ncbi:hypothetical protein LCGC14_2869760 [marine sediment metagenome]|uniref:Uncharacterized protein n=1 Tax=marine sediment metagenome TaxID=412755 RepID=A0A0F8Y3H4_9ZZZZ
MLCPMRKITEPRKGQHGEDYGTEEIFSECDKEKCQWWISKVIPEPTPKELLDSKEVIVKLDGNCAIKVSAEK